MEILILSSLVALLVAFAATPRRTRALGLPQGRSGYAAPTPRQARADLPVSDAPAEAALLIEHLAVDSPAIRAAVARCLGHVATPRTLDHLVALLDDPAVDVQVAAAEALGASAPFDLIAPLNARAAEPARAASFRRAVKDAVPRIQARHRRDPGRLSLADPGHRGALTLAELPPVEPAAR